jgi:predicted dehydrogenase
MTYRAGIIGAGGAAGGGFIGQKTESEERPVASHAGAYHATEGIELVAVADLDDERVAKFGETWDVPEAGRYTDHEAMLDVEDLAVVSVCTPSHLHAQHVQDAVHLGDPDLVWCEKPIASRVTDADDAVAACDTQDVELLVNHIRRFDPFYAELALDLRELTGEVQSVSATFKRELLRNGTHFLDIVCFLLDTRPVDVGGVLAGEEEATESLDITVDVDDSGGAGTISLADGTVFSFDCTLSREYWTGSLSFVGTGGKLDVEETDNECRYWDLDDGHHVRRELPIETTDIFDREAAWREAGAHVQKLLDGATENRSPGDEAVQALETLIGLFLSEYTSARVELPLARPLRDIEIQSW